MSDKFPEGCKVRAIKYGPFVEIGRTYFVEKPANEDGGFMTVSPETHRWFYIRGPKESYFEKVE